jgi:tRNA(fMet)-specific endonuclease VapC
LSVITVYELEFGAYRAGRASDLDDLRTSFKILRLTEEIAKQAARLDAHLIHQNIQVGIKDTFIAATCLVHDLPLLSMNIRHFDRVPKLQLIDPISLPDIDE